MPFCSWGSNLHRSFLDGPRPDCHCSIAPNACQSSLFDILKPSCQVAWSEQEFEDRGDGLQPHSSAPHREEMVQATTGRPTSAPPPCFLAKSRVMRLGSLDSAATPHFPSGVSCFAAFSIAAANRVHGFRSTCIMKNWSMTRCSRATSSVSSETVWGK